MLAQDEDTYQSIRGLVILLSSDPSVDGDRKITVPFPPVFIPCYVGDDWWILYEVLAKAAGEEELVVLAIGPGGTRPTLRS